MVSGRMDTGGGRGLMTEDEKLIHGIFQRISELEKKIETHFMEPIHIHADAIKLMNKERNEQYNILKDLGFPMVNKSEALERIEALEGWNKQNVGVATYNLWKQEISELGDRLQKCGVKWDFRLDELNGFIEELKEDIKNLFANETRDLDQLIETREVLRKFLKKSGTKGFTEGFRERQLKKLDGEKSTPSKNCATCKHNYTDSPFCLKCNIGYSEWKPKEPTEAGSARQTELYCHSCGSPVKEERNCFCRACFNGWEIQVKEGYEAYYKDLKADLEWLLTFGYKKHWHDGNKYTKKRLEEIRKKYLKEDADESL